MRTSKKETIREGSYAPLLVQIVSQFIAIQEEFKKSGGEFIILIVDNEGLSTHYYTIAGYKKTIELKMDDPDCKSILEYVEKEAAEDWIPIIHINVLKRAMHFVTAPLLPRKLV